MSVPGQEVRLFGDQALDRGQPKQRIDRRQVREYMLQQPPVLLGVEREAPIGRTVRVVTAKPMEPKALRMPVDERRHVLTLVGVVRSLIRCAQRLHLKDLKIVSSWKGALQGVR